VPAVSGGGGYPSAVTARVHSSMTAETKDAPAPELAIAPARDLLKEAMVAIQVKLKNFTHSPAAMLSLTWTGMPPASNAVLSAVLRGANASVQFSNRGCVDPQLTLLDSSVCHQGGIDESEPAKHTLWTESLRQNVDMANAI
jgi:hypothetical protein